MKFILTFGCEMIIFAMSKFSHRLADRYAAFLLLSDACILIIQGTLYEGANVPGIVRYRAACERAVDKRSRFLYFWRGITKNLYTGE